MKTFKYSNPLPQFLYALIMGVIVFTNTSTAKSIVYKNVNDLSVMQTEIKNDRATNKNTLVVYDIDDTLLGFVSFVGSAKWYDWQVGRKTYDASGQPLVIDKKQQFYCIFRTLGTLFEIGSTELTQNNAVDIFDQHKQFDLLILTARSAKYRDATERELKKHKIDLTDEHFKESGNGFDYQFNDGNRTARVTYKNGFIMAEGLNKGLILEDFLKKTNRHYTNIYFIDDSLKNVDNLQKVWKDKAGTIKIFHYTRVDKTINKSEILESDQAKYHFDGFLKNAFPEQLKAFQNNQCN